MPLCINLEQISALLPFLLPFSPYLLHDLSFSNFHTFSFIIEFFTLCFNESSTEFRVSNYDVNCKREIEKKWDVTSDQMRGTSSIRTTL